MPSRNTVKVYDAPAYYHVYNRGAGGQIIFRDAVDKAKFMSLLERYLAPRERDDSTDNDYPLYDLQLVAYCLMNNHFHLLFFQPNDPAALSGLMRSLSTAYSMYFNLRHKSQGHLFQSVFKASRITNEPYLAHITRYIHLNPAGYQTYKWSSLAYFLGKKQSAWIHPELVLDITPARYVEFLEDYEDRRLLLREIKSELAL